MRAYVAALLAVAISSTAPAATPPKRTKIAVPDVTERAAVDPGSLDGLAAVFADEAGKRPDVEVVSAAEIRALLGMAREQRLLGCDDSACLAEIGGALGVDLLLSSEVTRIGGNWLVSVSLVEMRTARVVARATRQVPVDSELLVGAREAAVEALEAWAPPTSGWTRGEVVSAACTGAGAILGTIGLYLLATGSTDVDEAVRGSGVYDSAAQEQERTGRNAQTAGAILAIAGGAALAGGLIAWPFTGDEAAGVSIAPAPGGARISWSLGF